MPDQIKSQGSNGLTWKKLVPEIQGRCFRRSSEKTFPDDGDENSDKTWLGSTPDSDESLYLDEDFDDDDEVSGLGNDDDDDDEGGEGRKLTKGNIEDDDDDDDGDVDVDVEDDEMSTKPTKTFDFDGVEIETKGNYSKCPRCEKNIKSTFILRHIKLHDLPVEKYRCPGDSTILVADPTGSEGTFILNSNIKNNIIV